ncbi:MAG TPA: undecaprenyl-diphosphatase, partial [Clostridiales bacterium]|nr:undecaprenyl-diphosphatase [Clostridiales bacterium]
VKIVKFGFSFTSTEVWLLLVGTTVSFAVAFFAVQFLMGYLKKHDFQSFGYYRIGLSAILLGYLLFFR